MTDSNGGDREIGRQVGPADGDASLKPLSRALLVGLGLGLIAILLTLAVLGWALDNNYRAVEGRVDQILNVEEPMSAAAHELEINVLGAGLAVLRYLETGDPVHRARIVKDEADFAQFKTVYDRLAQSEREQELGDRIDLLHRRYSEIGRTLMELRDRRAALHDQLTAGFDEVDAILDDQIQAHLDLNSPDWEAKLEASSSLEGDVAEMGTWLGSCLVGIDATGGGDLFELFTRGLIN